MKKTLYIMKPIHTKGDDPWDPWYDKAFGFVIRAESEEQARQFAHEEAGDENRGEFLRETIAKTRSPWLDPEYSTCKILKSDGVSGVILKDFMSA